MSRTISCILILLFCAGVYAQEERYIYVPLEEWNAVVAEQPKGVWLSYAKYAELLKEQPATSSEPVPVVVHRVEYWAEVVEKTLNIEIEMSITSLVDGPQPYRFTLGPLGMSRSALDGVPVPLTSREISVLTDNLPNQEDNLAQGQLNRPLRMQQRQMAQGVQQRFLLNQNELSPIPEALVEYEVELPRKGAHTLVLSCHQSLQEKRGRLSARMVLGQFSQQVFRLKTMPEMEYTTDPNYEPAEGGIVVHLGTRSDLFLSFAPKEKQDVKKPVVVAHTHASHIINATSVSSCFSMQFEVQHCPQKTFEVFLPLDCEITRISENRWEIEKDPALGRQKLLIQVDKEDTGVSQVTVKCRHELPQDGVFALPFAVAGGDDLIYQDGIVYVEKSPEIRVKTAFLKEVRQINPHHLIRRDPKGGSPYRLESMGGEPSFACVFWNGDCQVHFNKEFIVPEVKTSIVSVLTIYPDLLESASEITFDVTEGKVNLLRMKLPTGWATSKAHAYLSGAGSFTPFPVPAVEAGENLDIALPRKVSKGEKVKVLLLLRSSLDKWDRALPLVSPLSGNYLTVHYLPSSYLGVIADPDYKVTLAHDPPSRHIKSVDLSFIRSLKVKSGNLRLGFQVMSAEAEGKLEVTLKQPQTGVIAATYLLAEPDRLRCATVLVFDIQNASLQTFRFSLPSSFRELAGAQWANRLHITDEKGWIKEVRPEQSGSGDLEWTVTLQKKVTGSYSLYLSYEVPARDRFALPPLTVIGDKVQVKGVIGIAASSDAEISFAQKEEIEEIAVGRLPIFPHPEVPAEADFLHAFQYTRPDHRLVMNIRFHEKVEVVPAIITQAQVATFLTEPARERVYCRYHLSHSGMQFFKLSLPDRADFWSAIVDNKGEKAFREGNALSIPLPASETRRNVIEVVYEREVEKLRSWGDLTLERPQTDPVIPVRALNWKLYFPKDYRMSMSPNDLHYEPWYVEMGMVLSGLWSMADRVSLVQEVGTAPQATKEVSRRSGAVQDRKARGERQGYDAPQPAEMPTNLDEVEQSEALTDAEQDDDMANDKDVLKKPAKKTEENRRRNQNDNKPAMPSKNESEPDVGLERQGEEHAQKLGRVNEKLAGGEVPEGPPPPTSTLDKADGKDISGLTGELGKKLRPKVAEKEKDAQDWREKWSQEPASGPQAKPQTPAPDDIEETRAAVLTGKAKGLRSLELTLFGDPQRPVYNFNVRDYSGEKIKEMSPVGRPSLHIAYVRADTARSAKVWITVLATALGLTILAAWRQAAAPAFLLLFLATSVVSGYLGTGIIPYSNAAAWGLWCSLGVAALYRLGKRVGARLGTAVLCCIFFSLSSQLYAQPASPQNTGTDIYVPYDPESLEKIPQMKDVYIPYEHYVRLWNNAHPDRPLDKAMDGRPDFILYHARYSGVVLDRKVEFTAQFHVEAYRAPIEVPVGLFGDSPVAIEEATLSNGEARPAAIRPGESGYVVILPAPGRYRIDVKFLPPGAVALKEGEVAFGIVAVATSVLQVELGRDLGVDLPGFRGQWFETVARERKTVTAFPGTANEIRIKWFPDSQRYLAQGIEIKAVHDHVLELRDQLLTLYGRVNYQITGQCDKLSVRLPRDYTIMRLKCDRLDRWILSQEPGWNEVILRLKESEGPAVLLEFIATKALGNPPTREVFPDIVPVGVSAKNESGKASLVYHDAYEVFTKATPDSSRSEGEKFIQTFRYGEHPCTLVFDIDRQKVDNFTYAPVKDEELEECRMPGLSMCVDEDKVAVEYQAQIEVKGSPVFAHELLCPADFQVLEVRGEQVKSWRTETGEREQTIYILFHTSVPKGSRIPIYVRMEKDRTSEKVAVPYFNSPQTSRHSGTILVSSSEELDLTPDKDSQGVIEYDLIGFATPTGYAKRYAYHFLVEKGELPYRLEFLAQSKKPELEVDTVIDLMVEDYWLNWAYYLKYHVKFAGVDSFVFRLPAHLGKDMQIFGLNIREVKEPEEVEVERQKYLEWTVQLHNKVRGEYRLLLFPEVQKNPATGFVVPAILFPPGGGSLPKLSGQRTYIRLGNSSTYALIPQEKKGVKEGKTPGELLPPSGDEVIKSPDYEFKVEERSWRLSFIEQKREVVQAVRTIIDAICAETVLDEEGEARHRIRYCIRYGGLQFLDLTHLDGADLWGVFVSGYYVRPVKKTDGDGKEHILIPLHPVSPTQPQEQKLLVMLVYSQKVPPLAAVDSLRLVLPKVANIQEIGDVYWEVHLPKKYIYRYQGNVGILRHDEFGKFLAELRGYEDRVKTQTKSVQEVKDRFQLRYAGRDNAFQTYYADALEETVNAQQQEINDFNELVPAQNKELYSNYGQKSLNDLQQAAQSLKNVPRAGEENNVYADERDRLVASESSEEFLKRQEQKQKDKMRQRDRGMHQKIVEQDPYFPHIPAATKSAYFSKKQGDAELEIFSYTDPRDSKIWHTVQLLGFLALLACFVHLRLFSPDGYNWKKFGILGLLAGISVAWCFLLEVAYQAMQ